MKYIALSATNPQIVVVEELTLELKKQGYKEVVLSPSPDPSHMTVDYYEITDGVIYQRWQSGINKVRVKEEIERLKILLSDSDYKVIKTYEQSLANIPLDYDIIQVHAERQLLRDKINELGNLIKD